MDVYQVSGRWFPHLKAHYLVTVMLLIGLLIGYSARAQGNLLSNPGFEEAHGDGVTLTAPPGWSAWSNVSDGLVGRQLGRGTPEVVATIGVYEGNGSFDAYKGWAAYNVSLYQTVGGIQPGSTLRLTAFGRIWSCDSETGTAGDTCIVEGTVVNQTYTAANFRVGIDPAGTNDPNAGGIVWSNSTAPYTGFQQMTVDAVATADRVTVVLNASMAYAARHQHVFWDAASLTVIAGGAGGEVQPPPASADQPPALAPEVVPQGPREDGSIVHTVRPGDTLWAIAVAYNVMPNDILQLNGMTLDEARILSPGQELIIRQATGGGQGSAAAEESASAQTGEGQSGEAASQVAAQPTEQPIESYDPAPVARADVPMLRLDEPVSTGRVCVVLFEDTNPNRLQESGEGLLAGGEIALSQGGATVSSLVTDAESGPSCFDDLAPGEYMVSLTPPSGYGVTTASSYTISLSAGQTVDAAFGAVAGFVPPQPPPVQVGGLFSDEPGLETDTRTSPLERLLDYSGVIVLGLAGVVLVGGVALTLLLRR